jgi:hypothetical protein
VEEYFFFQKLVKSICPLFYLAFHHYAMLALKVNYLGRKSGKIISQDLSRTCPGLVQDLSRTCPGLVQDLSRASPGKLLFHFSYPDNLLLSYHRNEQQDRKVGITFH